MLQRLSEEQKRALAGIICLGLVIALLFNFGGPLLSRFLDVAGLDRVGLGRGEFDISGLELVDLRLDELQRNAVAYAPDRNLFGYYVPPPKPVPPPPPPIKQPPPPPPPQVYVDPGPPKPPPVDVKLVGIFGSKKKRIAVLRDGAEVINVVVGETIKNKFIVREIGFQTVEFGFVGFPETDRVRIELGG